MPTPGETGPTGEPTPRTTEILDMGNYAGLYGRFFLASHAPKSKVSDILNPATTGYVEHSKLTVLPERDYNPITQKLSSDERTAAWKGIEFNKAYRQWREHLAKAVKSTTEENQIAAIEAITGKLASEFNEVDADTFYNAFCKGKSDTTAFAQFITSKFAHEDGKIDVAALKNLSSGIKWVAGNLFGEQTAAVAVSRIIELETEIANNPAGVIDKVFSDKERVNKLTDDERKIFALLYKGLPPKKIEALSDDDEDNSLIPPPIDTTSLAPEESSGVAPEPQAPEPAQATGAQGEAEITTPTGLAASAQDDAAIDKFFSPLEASGIPLAEETQDAAADTTPAKMPEAVADEPETPPAQETDGDPTTAEDEQGGFLHNLVRRFKHNSPPQAEEQPNPRILPVRNEPVALPEVGQHFPDNNTGQDLEVIEVLNMRLGPVVKLRNPDGNTILLNLNDLSGQRYLKPGESLPSEPEEVVKAPENIITLETTNPDLENDLNASLLNQTEQDATFSIPMDALRKSLTAKMGKEVFYSGNLSANEGNEILITGLIIDGGLMEGKVTISLSLTNSGSGISARIQSYTGRGLAKGTVEQQVIAFDANFRNTINGLIADENPAWKTSSVAIAEDRIMVGFHDTRSAVGNLPG